jgi:hypothetical protein
MQNPVYISTASQVYLQVLFMKPQWLPLAQLLSGLNKCLFVTGKDLSKGRDAMVFLCTGATRSML